VTEPRQRPARPRVIRRRPLLVNGEGLRQTVDPPPRGGGDKFKPFTVEESLNRLAPQVRDLQARLAALPEHLRGDEPVVQARLLPNFLAATSFPAALFAAAGLVPLGTRADRADRIERSGSVTPDQPTKTVYLAVRDDLSALQAVIMGRSGRLSRQALEGVQALDLIQQPEPFVLTDLGDGDDMEPDEQGRVLYESVLHGRVGRDGRPAPAGRIALDRWADLVRELGGQAELEWVRPSGAVTFVPVRLTPGRAAQAAEFNQLRAVQPMPRIRALPDAVNGVLPFDPPLAVSTALVNPLRVAVFDGGVDGSSPFWSGRVRSVTVGSLAADERFQRHGAAVTSAMLYGHLDEEDLPEPADMLIDHYAVLPQQAQRPDLHMYWLLDLIDEQVRANDYDVVTVCVAPNRLVSERIVDRWTSTLDNLSHEKGVLFVIAAGNNGEDPALGGLNRIQVPADATNALAIGAADAPAPKAGRAVYSAVGPGRPGAQIRPSGVAFGGTLGLPFVAVDNDGTALRYCGTSCAAPLVTHGLADLAARLGRARVSPANLRAFAMHFARPCKRGHGPLEIGLGHFLDDWAFLRHGPANEAHVLYTGTIARGEFIPLSLPVPDGHVGKLELRYTLVTSTATDSADSVDYTKAGLEVCFRPHANRYAFTRDRSSVVINTASDAATATQLLGQGYRIASEPATENIATAARTEDELRAEGKWDSVRAGKHTYREAAVKVYRPRLEISHLARLNGVLVNDSPDLDWALLVTLRADGGVPIYERVRAQYGVLAALPAATVSVRARTA